MLCLTGTVLVFHDEIHDALGTVPVSPHAADAARRPWSESIANVLAAHPGERVLSVSIDDEHHPGMLLVATGARDARGFDAAEVRYADLVTAQPVGDPDAGETLTGFLLELHAQWFLGAAGELIGAGIAFLVLVSLLSGLVVYAPYGRRVVFGIVRRGRGARVLQLDLHNLIGAVVLGWAVVVTLTGFLLGFGTVAVGLWQMTELSAFAEEAAKAEPVDPIAPPVNADRVAAAATATAEPGWRVGTVVFPATEFSTPRHYLVLLHGTEGLDERLFRIAAVVGPPPAPRDDMSVRLVLVVALAVASVAGLAGMLLAEMSGDRWFFGLSALPLVVGAGCAWARRGVTR